MYPDKVNLLDQFESEHCRTHQWISYRVQILQHPFAFFVKGPNNLNENAITLRAQMIYDTFDAHMDSRQKIINTFYAIEKYIKENY